MFVTRSAGVSLMVILILVIFLLLCFSAFFSGSETAMMAINRYQLSVAVSERDAPAQLIDKLLSTPEKLIGMILVGNMIMNNMAMTLVTSYFSNNYPEWGIALAFVLLTLFQLVFCEVLPKTIAAAYSFQLSRVLVYPLRIVMTLLSPVVFLLSCVTNALLSCFGLSASQRKAADLTVDELKGLVRLGGRELPNKNRHMLLNILDIESVFVEDVMLPKQQMLLINIADSLSDIQSQLMSSECRHALFYRHDLDSIQGVLSLRRSYKLMADSKLSYHRLQRSLDSVCYVPVGSLLSTQLSKYDGYRKSYGVVVDEYGKLMGLLTQHEISRFVVGYWIDPDRFGQITSVSPSEVHVMGDVSVRSVNQALAVEMPTSGPVTLSGLVIEHLECLPDGPVSVKLDNVMVEVVEINENLIAYLKVVRVT
tara:strand:+ start:326 stop:1594 length:1269 start_codon:yes stop_codon:yes gene_type:complete